MPVPTEIIGSSPSSNHASGLHSPKKTTSLSATSDSTDDAAAGLVGDNSSSLVPLTSNNNSFAANTLNDSPSVNSATKPAEDSHTHSSDADSVHTDATQEPSIYSVNLEHPDPEIVKVVGRHLVHEEDVSSPGAADIDGNFDSLRLQGGDITRQLYKWQREHEVGSTSRGRSKSFDIPRPSVSGPDGESITIQDIKVPGGFRRNFISAKAQGKPDAEPPTFLTRNFIEFLSIYGHFAGEELDEDEDEEADEVEEVEEESPTENTALLASRSPRRPPVRRSYSRQSTAAKTTTTKAVLLLLKSFVGTGVLFLPKAFLNGGFLFSSMVLLFAATLSYWCFLLLIRSRVAVGVSSYGDVGGVLYGDRMRRIILFSIVFSQIGFAAAYIVFTSENMQALILSLTDNKTFIRIEALIFLQLLVFMPLSMIRNIAKLSGTALVADFFILLGLIFLYFWGGYTIATEGVADIKLFNRNDWPLFVGTAIFTFEGIGLIIPIQESMKKPAQFGPALGGVMVTITLIFISMGALSYAAYGSQVQTVVLLNLPKNSGFVNIVQALYSLAILLSTPLQLFPAIRIIENGLFVRSGKYNSKIKWQKNIFRCFLVFFTAFVAWGGAADLDRFVSLVGSFACIPLVYVYPPLLHLKAMARGDWQKASDLVLVAFGIGCMVYTTYVTLSSWVHP